MKRIGSGVVSFSADEVAAMLTERLRAEGVEQEIIGVQIKVEQPFQGNSTIHNEVPTLTLILANAGM